jgi:flavorubredoxin
MQASVDQIAERIYRISTYVPEIGPTGFTFNQFLVDAEEPLLYHTGMRGLFPIVSEAIAWVLPVEKLRWVAFAHVEADECGAMNEFLAAAPHAVPFASHVSLMTSLNDFADRKGRALADGDTFSTGKKMWRWIDTPHVPHGWDCGVLFD